MTTTEIRRLAEELATRYNPAHEAPFPYASIVHERSDLEVYYLDLQDSDASGAVLFRNNSFDIVINTTRSETRQHFTLGHELGHYFLHQDILRQETGLIDGESYLDGSKVMYRLDSGQRDQIEREANHFAACLLMPADLVQSAWEVSDDVEKMAELFRVSTVAMSIRLTELGLVE